MPPLTGVQGPGVERLRPDQRPAGGGVFGREEHLRGDLPHKPRVGDIFLGVHKGQLHRLDLPVEGKEGIMFRFEPFQDVQRHQHRDAVAVGRQFADGIAVVAGGERLDPFGMVGV